MTYLESFEAIKFHLDNGVNNVCIFYRDGYWALGSFIVGTLNFIHAKSRSSYKFRHNDQIIYLFNKNSVSRARGLTFDCCFVMPDSLPDFLSSQIGYRVKDFVYLCDEGEYLFDNAAEKITDTTNYELI